jgi:hypothetical protein
MPKASPYDTIFSRVAEGRWSKWGGGSWLKPGDWVCYKCKHSNHVCFICYLCRLQCRLGFYVCAYARPFFIRPRHRFVWNAGGRPGCPTRTFGLAGSGMRTWPNGSHAVNTAPPNRRRRYLSPVVRCGATPKRLHVLGCPYHTLLPRLNPNPRMQSLGRSAWGRCISSSEIAARGHPQWCNCKII